MKRQKLIINGDDYDTPDGSTIRDFIHVSDLADIHLIAANHLISNGNSNLFNCGYGRGYSVKEIVQNLNNILGKEIKVEIGNRREGDSKMIVSDVSKFKKFFKWEPKSNDIKKILESSIKWEKKLN